MQHVRCPDDCWEAKGLWRLAWLHGRTAAEPRACLNYLPGCKLERVMAEVHAAWLPGTSVPQISIDVGGSKYADRCERPIVLQARWVASLLTGATQLPSEADMLADCQAWDEEVASSGLPIRYS